MKRGELLVATVAIVALLGATCGGRSEADRVGAPPTAPAEVPTVESESATPPPVDESSDILSVLSVEREVDLLAQRDGVVLEIVHDQGSRVEKHTVLARLEDQDLLAQLDRARADLSVAESNVRYNAAELKARQAAYRRAQEMRELGLNSDADLEEAEFKAKGAEYDLQSWQAVVERTQAEIRMLELELQKTRIHAPFSGVVARRYIRSGENVLKDDKCFRLSQLAPLQVRFLVPETSGRHPRVGEIVEVKPASAGSLQPFYTARILRVSPVVDPASGGIEAVAQLTNPDFERLRPGMAVRVLWTPEPTPSP